MAQIGPTTPGLAVWHGILRQRRQRRLGEASRSHKLMYAALQRNGRQHSPTPLVLLSPKDKRAIDDPLNSHTETPLTSYAYASIYPTPFTEL